MKSNLSTAPILHATASTSSSERISLRTDIEAGNAPVDVTEAI